MNRGAMGNKWKLSKINKPKTSNINKINQGFKPNQVLRTNSGTKIKSFPNVEPKMLTFS